MKNTLLFHKVSDALIGSDNLTMNVGKSASVKLFENKRRKFTEPLNGFVIAERKTDVGDLPATINALRVGNEQKGRCAFAASLLTAVLGGFFNEEETMKIIFALLLLFIVMPIWYYLLYQILVRVNASELMFFLFWVYVPAGLLVSAMDKIAESK